MATLDGVRLALETDAVAACAATAALPMGVSRNRTLTGTKLRVLVVGAGVDSDSSQTRTVGVYRVEVLHVLADHAEATEETYLASAAADQAALLALSLWRGVTGVHEVLEAPALESPEIIGLVCEYSITARVSIDN